MINNQKGVIVPLVLFGVLAVLSGLGLFFYFRYYHFGSAQQVTKPSTRGITSPTALPITPAKLVITSFDSCTKAGYPVEESYPRRCSVEGKVFTEVIAEASSSASPQASVSASLKICVVAGCNSEVCVDEKDLPVATACGWDAEFACYQNAKCEVQADGNCGWSKDEVLNQCLQQTGGNHQ